MRTLIVDNSNTRTKLALANGDRLESWRAIIPTPEISPQSLADALGELSWDASIISSVVPDKALARNLATKSATSANYPSVLITPSLSKLVQTASLTQSVPTHNTAALASCSILVRR